MAVYFLDSSALVKRYVDETGTAWIDGLLDPEANNVIYLADITRVEVVSGIVRRGRAGDLDSDELTAALSEFRVDLASAPSIIEVSSSVISEAMTLAETHGLRGYDAVQLAAVLRIHREAQLADLPGPCLISGDVALNDAALLEGLTVDDPNNH